MYTPPHFREDDISLLHETIRTIAFGTLVTLGPDGLVASHVPMLLEADKGERGTVTGHLAKANIQAKSGPSDIEALAIFQGPDAYITPNWYATKKSMAKLCRPGIMSPSMSMDQSPSLKMQSVCVIKWPA